MRLRELGLQYVSPDINLKGYKKWMPQMIAHYGCKMEMGVLT